MTQSLHGALLVWVVVRCKKNLLPRCSPPFVWWLPLSSVIYALGENVLNAAYALSLEGFLSHS